MARGSSKESGATNTFSSIEMLQGGGQVDNSGKYTVSRKYYVTNEEDLITTPQSISVGGKAMYPYSLSYQKISGGVWEKTIEFSAPLKSTDTGVVKSLSIQTNQEGRVQIEVSAELKEIELHPEIEEIKKKYNGTVKNNKIIFPEKYTEIGTGTSGGSPKKNPFFGVRYFYAPSATLRHTYTLDKMPTDLWDKVFKIVPTEKLPGGFPPLADYLNKEGATLKYYWQIHMPEVALVGGRIEVTDTYKLMTPMPESAAADFNTISAG
jgi:hypothetical protein